MRSLSIVCRGEVGRGWKERRRAGEDGYLVHYVEAIHT